MKRQTRSDGKPSGAETHSQVRSAAGNSQPCGNFTFSAFTIFFFFLVFSFFFRSYSLSSGRSHLLNEQLSIAQSAAWLPSFLACCSIQKTPPPLPRPPPVVFFFLGFFAAFVITAERRRCCDVSRAMQQDGPSKTPGRAGRGGATLSHVGIRNTEGFAAAHNTPPPAHAAALFTFNTKSLLIPKKKKTRP